jgi:sulfoxide reductase catalytic subunit YedY
MDPSSPHAGTSSKGNLYPAPRNPRYVVDDRATTAARIVTSYNNYYEFGFGKDVRAAAQLPTSVAYLAADEWVLDFDGENMNLSDVLSSIPLEERLYRHRCVEAWSMVMVRSATPFDVVQRHVT